MVNFKFALDVRMSSIDWYAARARFARSLGFELQHSQQRYWKVLEEVIEPGVDWLDLGCGWQITQEWAASLEQQRALASRANRFAGIDLDAGMSKHPLLDDRVFGSGESLPFVESCFDVVTANMVVEHLADPVRVFSEIRRVLRPGGRFVFHTPNKRYYTVWMASLAPEWLKNRVARLLDDRPEEDIFPTFYRANTPEAVRRQLGPAGLEDEWIRIGGSVGDLAELGPLGMPEIVFLRLLETDLLRRYSVTLIACLRRPR